VEGNIGGDGSPLMVVKVERARESNMSE